MATIIDIGNLGAHGYKISGDALSNVSFAGDINGDGFADVMIGASKSNEHFKAAGAVYVLFGKADGFADIDVTPLTPADGFTILGAAPGDLAGFSVSSAGDVNGDGFADMMVGAPANEAKGQGTGQAYVIFGKAGGFGTIDLGALGPAAGFTITGAYDHDAAGFNVASAGDINGDGFADIMVNSTYSSGATSVIFGKATGLGPIDLRHLTSKQGFTIWGDERGDGAGRSMASAGDVNGDGIDDMIIGAPYHGDTNTFYGTAYVVYGKTGGFRTMELGNLTPADGFEIDSLGFKTGTSVSGAGDINGDGFADMVVGGLGTENSFAHVFFGSALGFNPTSGFEMRLNDPYDYETAISVSSAGDVNGDGFDDMIVGISNGDDSEYNAGQAYVVYGKASGFSSIDLAHLADDEGFVIQGDARFGGLGSDVSAAGDLNGDGFDDLIVGSSYRQYGAGPAYVIFGMAPTESVTRVGTDIDNTIHGGAGDDVLDGRDGNDTLIGGLGNDSLFGQRGDDVLIAGGGNDTLVGDDGNDTLDGQGGNDDLSGGDGKDRITGGVGDDLIHGGTGNDRLSGSAGNDVLYGGAGKDLLNGGAGADSFHFSLGGTGTDARTADRIADFSQGDHDLMDLTDYDADPSTPATDPFRFVGTTAFSGAAGELRYEVSGKDTLVSGDTNGDAVADFVIRLTGNIALTASDFLLTAPAAQLGGGHLFLALEEIHLSPQFHLA